MSKAVLSRKDAARLEEMKAQPIKPKKQGVCATCMRDIPYGYLALVTKWESVEYGTIKVSIPRVMYCRNCEPSSAKGKHVDKITAASKVVVEDKTNKTPLDKDLAAKLMKVMSKVKPHSPRWMIKRAGLTIDKSVAITTLKKLYSNGTVDYVDGQWLLK
jgi:hypothetical protein